jgi:hypothetical protein
MVWRHVDPLLIYTPRPPLNVNRIVFIVLSIVAGSDRQNMWCMSQGWLIMSFSLIFESQPPQLETLSLDYLVHLLCNADTVEAIGPGLMNSPGRSKWN